MDQGEIRFIKGNLHSESAQLLYEAIERVSNFVAGMKQKR